MGNYCFGIDVGGTSVKCGLFQTDGTLVEKWEIPTRKENNGEKIIPDIAKTILDKIEERKLDKSDIDGVGIGVPGPVNDKGEVLCAVNLFWGSMERCGSRCEECNPGYSGNRSRRRYHSGRQDCSRCSRCRRRDRPCQY